MLNAPLDRKDVFFSAVSDKYGSYVAYVIVYAFSLSVYALALFAALFLSLEFVRYRDVEGDISSYANAVYAHTIPS